MGLAYALYHAAPISLECVDQELSCGWGTRRGRRRQEQPTTTIKQQLKKSKQEIWLHASTIAQGLFILGPKDRTENVVFFLKPF